MSFLERVREICAEAVPLPGAGATAERHRRLFEVARENVSLAKIVEAHWDAVAILAEAGCEAERGKVYAVWASEAPGKVLQFEDGRVSETKLFCSGAGLVDRALLTVDGERMVECSVEVGAAVEIDGSAWKTEAFRLTQTSAVTFHDVPATQVGAVGFYLERAGFWHGACGPAACWAGGATGLLDWAMKKKRDDPHTLAHLGAMHADVEAMRACLEAAGRQIDCEPVNREAAAIRALSLRYTVVETASDVLRRFARAYGPQPLAMEEAISRRYAEVDLYLRQSHGERDLEALGRALRAAS